ncbi:MAG TPA: 30S ribosomal protein S11 [Candidatus Paceibacterota bacterium]|jgi:small subunit ribosomal protein S11|nr:30S ribosomal protein S11 [Candidatus Paceibacterota bacterium]HRS47686.1 30S ribosomal protein S11 [Candidatus Paceibacterota bacterium]
MGKKTVKTETAEEALKEKEVIEESIKKSSQTSVSKKFSSTRIYIDSTYNNTYLTVTDEKGNVLAWSSAGSLGFKGPKKSTPFAATSVVETLLSKLKKVDLGRVAIYVKGIGGGRAAAIRALINNNLDIYLIKDITPIPFNGPRPKKPRRV